MKILRLVSYAILAAFPLANNAFAGRLVVILRSGASGWQLQDAEKVLVNGKQKIRLGTGGITSVDGEEYKHFAAEPIGNTILRIHNKGYLLYRSAGSWQPVLPDGVNMKASIDLSSLWSEVAIEIQAEKGAKTSNNVNVKQVFAILPGSDPGEAAVDFLSDEANFTGVGEADSSAAFDERMSLLVSISSKATPGVSGKLKGMLLKAMNASIQKTSGGVAKYADILEGLKFAAVSEKAFLSDPQQKEARDTLTGKKLWVDRRIAILRALNAGDQNDAFLDKYGEFELYDNSFPEMRALRDEAFKASAASHIEASEKFLADRQYETALAELNIARSRNPGDKSIPDKIQAVSDERARHSHKVKPVDLNSPVQIEITRLLARAEYYEKNGNPKGAEQQLALADAKDKDSYRILLGRAKLFESRKQYHQALEYLDRYDRLVSEGADISAGQALRETINLELAGNKEKLSEEIKKGEDSGDYTAAMAAAKDGLDIDSEDPFFLYHSAINAAFLRKPKDSRDFFKRYLAASESNPAESALRANVLNLLPSIQDAPKMPGGTPNWFSGYDSPAGLFYCPLSLMPNAQPTEVKGSHNETTRFNWSNGQLTSVNTVAQKPDQTDVTVYFEYQPGGKGVRRVGSQPLKETPAGEALKFTPQGTVGPANGTYVTLFNNPIVDPYMIEKLTGKRVGVIVSGNPYFHPFVWLGVHAFVAEYDNQGRVISAKPLDPKSSDHPLTFAWEGNQLKSVSADGYRRDIQYSNGHIARENIQAEGKNSKIEYKYKDDRLVEVNCDPDPSIDGRSRRVTFE
jgi:hypothetical protein